MTAHRAADGGISVVSDKPPKVVACVPCWNAAAFIEETLESLVGQTYANLEVLVSDDCSTDETLAICRAFATEHSNVRVIAQKKNLGWIGNVDALMAQADGNYLFFAFHDDIIGDTFVEKTVAALESNPDAVLAFTDVLVHDLDGTSHLRIYRELESLKRPLHRGLRVVARRGHWFVPTRGVFRIEAKYRVGGPRKHRRGEYEADWVWLLQMALLGAFVRVPGVLCNKRYKPASRSLAVDWSHDSDNKVAVMESLRAAIGGSHMRPWQKVVLMARAWPRLYRHRLGRAVASVIDRLAGQ